MAVAVGGDDPSTWPKPKMLFEGPYLLYTVDADGEGALVQLVVVQNWFEELRRLAPRK